MSTTDPGRRRAGLTWRSLLLGAVVIVLNDLWIAQMEPIQGAGRATIFALNFATLFPLLILLAGNAGLTRLVPKLALSQGELAVVYLMATIGLALGGTDGLQVLVPFIAGPAGNATPENGWAGLLVDRLPDAFVLKDPAAIAALYRGHASFADHARAWARPLVSWSLFVWLLVGVTLCLATLLRRQWTDRERLAYPLVAVPLELLRPEGHLWRNRLFQGGFTLAAVLMAINQLHAVVPAVPEVRTAAVDLRRYLSGPWKQAGSPFLAFYPWAIGLGFLLPVDLLLSSWVFYLWWQCQRVFALATGFGGTHPDPPWVLEQTAGAYFAICLAALWLGRQAWRGIGRQVFGNAARDDAAEPFGYRLAVWGALLGLVGLVWLASRTGLGCGLAVLVLVIFFANTLTVTRVRAEFGAPVHDLINADPGRLLIGTFGGGAFSVQQTLGLSLTQWFCRGYRSSPAPFMLEGYRLGDGLGLNRRSLAWAIAIAALIGVPAALAAMLQPLYALGLDSGHVRGYARLFTTEQWSVTASWLQHPPRGDLWSLVAMLVGAGAVWLLMAARLRFVGWPLHPVAYAVTSSWTMGLMWAPLMIAWGCKAVVLRAGGLRLYRQARPFFLGLLLGDFTANAMGQLAAVLGGWRAYPLVK